MVHSVDHDIPLVNPFVCGLHVESNLLVCTLADNVRKGATWGPDEQMPLI